MFGHDSTHWTSGGFMSVDFSTDFFADGHYEMILST
jgi:hypothetical protein